MTSPKESIATRSGPIEIVFEDAHVLALGKPAGLLSQGDSSGDENLVDVLRTYFGRHYVGLVHRLDRNVSGLMIVGKRSKAADRLSEALRSGALVRRYVARVTGRPSGDGFRLEHHLLKNERTNETSVVAAGTAGAKSAVLNGRFVRAAGAGDCIVELTLETGRSHQIRAQLAAAGMPIRNDAKYGGVRDPNAGAALFLHSAFLSFPHPMSKETMEFHAVPNWAKPE